MVDPIAVHKARAVLDLWARLAREDVGAFFELVMKHETKRTPLRLAEHQRIVLSFLVHHRRATLILPIRTSKTFLAACLTLWFLGRNPTLRGAVVSATQEQAQKVLGMVSDYIVNSAELKLVFPHLRETQRSREPWTQVAITVDRPAGIRDASLKAIGLDGAIAGSRLDWIIIDDVLTQENTLTSEGCRKTIEWLDSSVLTRLEPSAETRVLGLNTPWNPKDAIHEFERRGWATMRMSIDGTIRVQDDIEEAEAAREVGRPYEFWDHPSVEPRTDDPRDLTLRIKAHAPGESLWPEVYPVDVVRRIKRVTPIREWNRAYMCTAVSDEEARCKIDWIERCKDAARKAHIFGLTTEWPESSTVTRYAGKAVAQGLGVFTGVDLAVKTERHHDKTAFFTFVVLPDGRRRILDIETGHYSGPVIVEKCIRKHQQFGGVIVVEDIAAQGFILQFIRKRDLSIPVRPYVTTAKKKADPLYGVETIFTEMSNGAWLIPNDEFGRMHPEVEAFVQACLEYKPDNDHVADILMASFMAREMARKWGLLTPEQREAQSLSSVMMR